MSEIEQHHIDSATRGLMMRALSKEELQQLIDIHSHIEMFASRVIVDAAERELQAR